MTAPRDPQDRHLDAGAYVLGLLGEADRTAFEEHLAGCPRCATEVAELGGLEPMLAEFAAAAQVPGGLLGTAPDAVPSAVLAGPSPRLLARTLAEVRGARRRQRARRLALLAAAAVLIVGGPAVTATVIDSGAHQSASAAVWYSATGADGTRASVGVTGEGWGSAINLRLTGVTGPRNCSLLAVPADGGAPQTVTSWQISPAGYGAQPVTELDTSGGTGYHPGEINHFEVRDLATNSVLVSIPVA
ncbi:anti-sigma factor family protein [Kitasatospora sp. NPDC052896]|uniref:anti-sigma factor family protein n=1 Tax=Kitasatospora sp. NPDC052896 TaxID=3364061 RepID=UPI0037CCB719